MQYTWFPGLTLCMTMLSNTTMEPSRRADSAPMTVKNGIPYTRYLQAAMILIKAAMSNVGTEEDLDRIDEDDTDYDEEEQRRFQCPDRPMDCEELLGCGFNTSGIYRIYPKSRLNTWGEAGFDVYCDMDTDGGGWTVMQRRDDFGTSSDFFYKGWQSYKFGFGDLNHDYWLGNDKIFALSNQRRSTLRIDLWDFEGNDGYANYDNFYIDDETQGYRLHLGDYRGIIGDSFKGHNLCKFSTRDRDNDNNPYQNCALQYKGGWWYNNCHTVNLNGLYLKGRHDTYADGVNWYTWKGFRYSLRKTEMKVRSSTFLAKPFNRLEAISPLLKSEKSEAKEM
ncbi:techylectin-5A-like [Argiope bruennichi]|uniref:techylectin-5A-like n=1 Tax=Argiope bruennichi TaxID=94029 RepID=UPI002494FF28|nr:techylectin-5A-like [Argiope bruennichi]